ncbi:Glycerol-3-phosphate acyltransferase (GPAT), partial [Durusdinium trenchii]
SLTPPDIVALSLQEIVQLGEVTSYVQNKKSEEAAATWGKAFKQTLEAHKPYQGTEYVVAAVSQMIGVMTCVLVRKDHFDKVSDVMIGYCAVGRFGVIGNKGAVAVRLKLQIGMHKFKTLCFVGSHLSAHQKEVAKRNADYAAIIDGLGFVGIDEKSSTTFLSKGTIPVEQILGLADVDAEDDVSEYSPGAHVDFSRQTDLVAASYGFAGSDTPLRIDDHDMVFWFGDLNYRIDGVPWQEAISLIKQKNFSRLLEMDQLILERSHHRVFGGFDEGQLSFPPSYKFKPGTNMYDTKTQGNKKVRVPAWCDRILWKAKSNSQVQQCSYFTTADYLMSDHKPVGSEFVLPFVELSKVSRMSRVSRSSGAMFAHRGKAKSQVVLSQHERGRQGASKKSIFGQHNLRPVGSRRSDGSRGNPSSRGGVLSPPSSFKAPAWPPGAPSASSGSQTSTTAAAPSAVNRLEESYQSVIAVRDVRGTTEDELTFDKGDLIELFMKHRIRVDDGWLLGRRVTNGDVGYFPADSVNALGTVTRTHRVSIGTEQRMHKASAVRFDRKKGERDQRKTRLAREQEAERRRQTRKSKMLTALRRIVLLQVRTKTRQRTWSDEYLGGNRYAEMRAKANYDAEDADELSFRKGDIIEVVSICPDADNAKGWYMGRLHNQQGLVGEEEARRHGRGSGSGKATATLVRAGSWREIPVEQATRRLERRGEGPEAGRRRRFRGEDGQGTGEDHDEDDDACTSDGEGAPSPGRNRNDDDEGAADHVTVPLLAGPLEEQGVGDDDGTAQQRRDEVPSPQHGVDLERGDRLGVAKHGAGKGLAGNSVDIMSNLWKVRRDRDVALPSAPESRSLWKRFLSLFGCDVAFAFGPFRGGDLVGPPHSIQHMYADKVQITPTRTPAEGFESTCENPAAGPDFELDSSLQQISTRMKQILTQIEGRCRMSAVRFLAWVLSKLWRVMFSHIDVDIDGLARLRRDLQSAADNGSAVMLLPTHRSHIDYLLMSYVAFGFNVPVPHIAAGDNLNIPVIGPLFSYSGAFFLRRSFRGDNLYKKVLYGYLLRKLREGAPVEVFVEGGRSRTGMISEPKLGMILMAVRFVRDGSVPDITLLPSSIDYERVLETGGHVDQLLGSKKKKETLVGTAKSGLGVVTGSTTHGGVFVNFSDGISIKKVMREVDARFAPSAVGGQETSASGNFIPEEVYVNAVAQAVVKAQRKVSMLTPASFVAAALLGQTKEAGPNDYAHLAQQVCFLHTLAKAENGNVSERIKVDSPSDVAKVLHDAGVVLGPALALAAKDASVSESEHMQQVAKSRLRLRYSCGQLVPFLAPFGVVAAALNELGASSRIVRADAVIKRALLVAEIVRFGIPGAQLDVETLQNALQRLADLKLVLVSSDTTMVSIADEDASVERSLRTLHMLVAPCIHAYGAVLSAVLSLMQSSVFTKDDLVAAAREAVYAQIRHEYTDWAKQQQQQRVDSESAAVGLSPIAGLPEALSTIEIRAAVDGLVAAKVIAAPTPYGGLGGGSTGNLGFGMPPMSSNASLISVASSRSLFSAGSSSDLDTADRKSTSGASEPGAAPNKPSFEVCSAFRKNEGLKLLERTSTVQRFMFRGPEPCFEVAPTAFEDPKAQPSSSAVVARFSTTAAVPSKATIGFVVLMSGMMVPLLRIWRKSINFLS